MIVGDILHETYGNTKWYYICLHDYSASDATEVEAWCSESGGTTCMVCNLVLFSDKNEATLFKLKFG